MKATSDLSLFQVSEIKVSYHPKFKACERPKINTSRNAYDLLYNNWDLGRIQLQEQFFIVLLNRANYVIGMKEISAGGMSGTIADPKLIFSTALKCHAANIIISHNHPSGNLKPSSEDLSLTQRVVEAGKLLDLHVLDHIIMTSNGYYSFGDEGLI